MILGRLTNRDTSASINRSVSLFSGEYKLALVPDIPDEPEEEEDDPFDTKFAQVPRVQ